MSAWEPGTVAMISVEDFEDRPSVRVVQHVLTGVPVWMILNDHAGTRPRADGGFIRDSHVAAVRPLVVIDPEDAEQVARLRRLVFGPLATAQPLAEFVAALREFAAPTPAKPDEPQGRYASVVDADTYEWVRLRMVTAGDDRCVWGLMLAGGEVREWRAYADIPAVRVLSEGVTP